MQGILVTHRGGVIPVHGWQQAPPVLTRWGLLFARIGFELDPIAGCNFFLYEQRRGNSLSELWQDSSHRLEVAG